MTFSAVLSYALTYAQEGLYVTVKDERPATTKEVADFLGLEPHTLECWRSEGRGPSYLKLAKGHVRYSWPAVREWLASQAVGTTEQGVA